MAAEIEVAVLKILTGSEPAAVAHGTGLDLVALTQAAESYRQAGRRALRQPTQGQWWQVSVEFGGWDHAEQAAATNIVPLLRRATDRGVVDGWWFIRKRPHWRLRLRHGPVGRTMIDEASTQLDDLVAGRRITSWRPDHYEPESAAFGGDAGMSIAHELFCADSRALFDHFYADPPFHTLGRRELSMVLSVALMRGAGLEWYEIGDVWHRVTLDRRATDPPAIDLHAAGIANMAADIKSLMLADTTLDGPLLGSTGRLAGLAGWASAFHQAGTALRSAARDGTLERGIREIISYHVIFHWNRIGLPTRTQSILAQTARQTILGEQ